MCAPLRELRREVCVYLSVGGVVWCEVVGFFCRIVFSVPRDKTGSRVLGKHLATELYLLVVNFLFVLRQDDDL